MNATLLKEAVINNVLTLKEVFTVNVLVGLCWKKTLDHVQVKQSHLVN